MKFQLTGLLSLLALAATPSALLAHSDLAKPIYVSVSGTDSGRCQSLEAPCASLAYAVQQAGKGNQVRVGPGRFEVRDLGTVFQLVSGTLDIRGGFDFERGEAAGAKTVLVGVPSDYRTTLAKRGFHVVADTKSIKGGFAAGTASLLKQRDRMQQGLKTAPCESGSTGGLACDRVDLLSHVPLGAVSATPERGADVWGFVDLNSHREYAFMGYGTGTAVFDVSDSDNPREIGFIDGQDTFWRDIKVVQTFNEASGRFEAFAYVTTDGAGDGLFVIDLRDLPHRVSRVAYSSDFSAAHNLFAVSTDYATGLPLTDSGAALIIAGSNNGTGIFRNYSLDVPDSPFFTTMPNAGETVCAGDGCYMHDASSMIIDDARIGQCPNATSYCEVLFDFNESTVDLWDITDRSDPVRLSRTPYVNSAYTHSGWPSEDKRTLYVHDELDERDRGLNTTLRAFSLDDLAAPASIGSYVGSTDAIDHNGFVRGNRYYMSNYSDGLTILDITDPARPARVGFLDTFPAPAGPSFVGAWGVFPYFPSGLLAVSDIDSGLYLAADRTLDVPQGTLSFSSIAYAAPEGGSATLEIRRSGGTAGAVSVGVEVLSVTAGSDDVDLANATLNWADGDGTPRSINVDALVDAEDEPLEQLIVRLVAPTGGSTLSAPAETSLFLSDSDATSSIEFDREQIAIAERGFATAVAVVRRRGSAIGAVSVDYQASDVNATNGADYSGTLNGTLSWADGDATPRWIEFPISDDGVAESSETFQIALSNAAGGAVGSKSLMTVEILDADGINAAPNANPGSARTVASGSRVTLDGSGSSDPDGDAVTYAWTQTLGPVVSLENPDSASPSFTAPTVSSDSLLRFELAVTDPVGLSDTASVAITVSAPGAPASGGGGGGGAPSPLFLLLVSAACLRRIIRRDAA